MRLLLDQGVPRSAVALLRAEAIEALHTGDVGLSSATDEDIVAWCRDNTAIAVTLDADFHAQIALSGGTSPSAIRLRIEGLKGPDVARILATLLRLYSEDLASGALITVRETRVRMRRLPIVASDPQTHTT